MTTIFRSTYAVGQHEGSYIPDQIPQSKKKLSSQSSQKENDVLLIDHGYSKLEIKSHIIVSKVIGR